MYFEKTENKRMKYGIELVQIRYTKDNPFFNVKAGQLGGWVSEKAFLEQNGKWFLHENAEVYDGWIYGGYIRGGSIYGGEIRDGEIWDGEIWGGSIYGGEIRGGVIHGGVIHGGEIRGGWIYGGEIRGGYIDGGKIDGDLPDDFGQVPCLIGGRHPVNFAGYSKEGERKFACGCQVYEESKWTQVYLNTHARINGFAEQQRILAEKLFEVVKEMAPKKTIQIPEKSISRDPKTGRFQKKGS
jgi:hypothetical protein